MTARTRRAGRVFMKTAENSPQGDDFHQRIRALEALDYNIAAIYHIKVVGDKQVVTIEDGKFIWAIEEDIAGLFLLQVEIDVTTASTSGIVQVQLRNIDNGNVDMLSTRAQVDANETHSSTASTQPVVNLANAEVAHGDRIAIDVDDDGTNAKGLGVVAVFAAPTT